MERILIRSQDLLQGIPAEVSDHQIGEGYTAVVLSTDAQATVEALRRERDELREMTKVICGHCCEPMAIPSKAVLQTQLTQLKALVRALPVVETELSDKHRAIHISASISINSEVHGLVDPLKALLDYRRTLDATPPERGEG